MLTGAPQNSIEALIKELNAPKPKTCSYLNSCKNAMSRSRFPKELDENDENEIMLENYDCMGSLIKEPNESSDSVLVKKPLSESEEEL